MTSGMMKISRVCPEKKIKTRPPLVGLLGEVFPLFE
jgi:hypothetical protein